MAKGTLEGFQQALAYAQTAADKSLANLSKGHPSLFIKHKATAGEADLYHGVPKSHYLVKSRLDYIAERVNGARRPVKVEADPQTADEVRAWWKGKSEAAAAAAGQGWEGTYDGTMKYLEALGVKVTHSVKGMPSVKVMHRNNRAFIKALDVIAAKGMLPTGMPMPAFRHTAPYFDKHKDTLAYYSMSPWEKFGDGHIALYSKSDDAWEKLVGEDIKNPRPEPFNEGLEPGMSTFDALVYTAVHEIGHFYHSGNDPKRWDELTQIQGAMKDQHGGSLAQRGDFGALSEADRHKVAGIPTELLSGYGRCIAKELVAEVFTRMVLGKPLDPEVFRVYRELGGYVP
jgi:hypothetical protein